MRTLQPAVNYYILKLVKTETETKTASGLLLVTRTSSVTKLYEIIADDECGGGCFMIGDIVIIKGYPDIVEIDGETFYIVHQDNVIAEVVDESVLEE